jgi:hypothetical protein
MDWRSLQKAVKHHRGGTESEAGLSRRDMLAGLGMAGVLAMAGPALLSSRPAQANPIAVAPTEPKVPAADAPAAKLAEPEPVEHTEFTSQRWRWRRRWWRRRRWRWRCRRFWRRGRWRRRCWRVW